uniref:Notch n=1 Tax=Schistocephalus solidus TaxID=70667 RepID=A0A183T8G2_SCHSO
LWLGARCETKTTCANLNCGEHGTCLEESDGIPRCICSDGWHGPTCELPIIASAAANPEVAFPNLSGDRPSCMDAPCQHGALCAPEVSETGERSGVGFRCLCDTALGNYTGPLCDLDVDECLSNPCLNGATCVNTPGSFVCKCLSGFVGDRCEKPVDPCIGRVCANGGVCRVVSKKTTCDCPIGFEGPHCELEVNECSSNPCQRGGTCFAFMGSHICKCPQGTAGPNCEHILECDSGDCPTRICRDEECLNGGKCSNAQHGSICECPHGFYGRNCEASINLCHQLLRADLNSPGRPQLIASERYLPLMAATAVMATQLPAYSPHLTEKNLLSALHVSKTQLGPCYPNGTFECIPGSDNFTCACYDGFQGRYCEKRQDFCAEAEKKAGGAICLNGGVCRNRQVKQEINSFQTEPFECICQPGFNGPRCEKVVPVCDSNPCVNKGRCVIARTTDSLSGNPSNKIQCICPDGLGGATCEVDTFDECSVTGACLNGGRCIDGPGNVTCECPDGFCGQRCELTGFVCTLEAVNSPVKWPGADVELSLCKLAKCTEKADNGVCDRECDHLACGFDAGECLFPVLALEKVPFSSLGKSGEDVPQPKLATPWSHCASISELGVPCHLRFGDGKCDSVCANEACLYDGWDCLNNSEKEVTAKHPEPATAASDTMRDSGAKTPVHFSENLLIVLDVAPSLLVNRSAHFEDKNFEHELLAGLMQLLRCRLRFKRQPSTGAPMIYPVSLKVELPSDKGLSTAATWMEASAWSIPTALMPRLNLSVTDLFSAQGSVREKLQQLLLQLADVSTSAASCFHDVETAAQFLSASIRRRRYAPPIGQILSVETASQSTVDFFLASTGGGGSGRGQTGSHSTENRLWGWRATIIYCFIGLLCTLCLTCLLGVLYGLVQRRAHVSTSASSEACILGTGYAQKSLIKKIRTTGIWYPGHHNRESRTPVFGLGGAVGDAPSTLQSRSRTTNFRSSFPPWRLETALRFGRLHSRRARIPPGRETETTQTTDQMSLHPPPSLPPPSSPSTCEGATTGFLPFPPPHHLAEAPGQLAQRAYPQGGPLTLVSTEVSPPFICIDHCPPSPPHRLGTTVVNPLLRRRCVIGC